MKVELNDIKAHTFGSAILRIECRRLGINTKANNQCDRSGGVGLENIVKKIIAIDKKAEAYRIRNREQWEKEMFEFELELQKMKDDFENKLSLEVKTIQDEILNKAYKEAKHIVFEREIELEKTQERYNLKAESIVQSLFQELKEKMKEG